VLSVRPSFNTAGPCVPGEHYMLPPERRLGDVLALIEAHRFFTLHAGRQTGKTTSLMWLEDHLDGAGRCRAVWVDLDQLGLGEGWLVMFDLREGSSWGERITTREVEHRGKRVHVVGC